MDIPRDEILPELLPFFDVCLILFFGICDRCGREQEFESQWPKFTDAYWLDEARALNSAGWKVVGPLNLICPNCQRDRSNEPPCI